MIVKNSPQDIIAMLTAMALKNPYKGPKTGGKLVYGKSAVQRRMAGPGKMRKSVN